jgi:hypothetical protein
LCHYTALTLPVKEDSETRQFLDLHKGTLNDGSSLPPEFQTENDDVRDWQWQGTEVIKLLIKVYLIIIYIFVVCSFSFVF